MDSPLKRPKILKVGSDPDITFTFRKIQERAGFDVDTYNDSLMTLRAFKPETYDILLIDSRMQNMNGFDLCKKITEIASKQKVCSPTAFDSYHGAQRLLPTISVECFL